MSKAVKMLGNCLDIVSIAADQEQYSLDNIPENLQESALYEKMEDAVSDLEDACNDIEEAIECINNASS